MAAQRPCRAGKARRGARRAAHLSPVMAGLVPAMTMVRVMRADRSSMRGCGALHTPDPRPAAWLARLRTTRPVLQPSRHVIELLDIAVADREHALPVGAMHDAHGQAERIGEPFLQRGRVRIRTYQAGFAHIARLPLPICTRHLLDLAHVKALLDDHLRELFGVR